MLHKKGDLRGKPTPLDTPTPLCTKVLVGSEIVSGPHDFEIGSQVTNYQSRGPHGSRKCVLLGRKSAMNDRWNRKECHP